MAWPAIKAAYDNEGFRRRVAMLSWPRWRPKYIMWHNTAAPSMKQWIVSANADVVAKRVPGISRIKSLENFFHHDNGWSGCPHLFLANDAIWEMNPLMEPGVHSPSFNNTAIGMEMIGDFDTEDDDSGEGLKVKQNTIYATAILCSALGIDPEPGITDKHARKVVSGTIFLHKQDWATTHDCPGKDVAADFIQMVDAVRSLMSGGDHDPHETAKVIAGEAPKVVAERQGVTTTDDLNLRTGPGAVNASIGKLPANTSLTILAVAPNGADKWLRVKTPAGYLGWVSARFVKEKVA